MEILLKLKSVFLGSLFAFSVLPPSSSALPKGVNGGVTCLGCTALVSINQQIAEYKNITFAESYNELCSYLPPIFSTACFVLGSVFLPIVQPYQSYSPDVICHSINLCYTEKGKRQCNAYPKSKLNRNFKKNLEEIRKYIEENGLLEVVEKLKEGLRFDICVLPGVREVCHWLNRVFSRELPLFDFDADRFSSHEELRGFAWRGKDCNDFLNTHYPGRKPILDDVLTDSNCNGIHGFDLFQWKPWEELLCRDSGPFGTIVLGDSAAAHFRIPPEWLTATQINQTIFKNLVFAAENELDWPMLSAFTGYLDKTKWPEIISGPVDSVYKHVVNRNLCNHRDFQNIGKNGADSFEMNDFVVKALARNKEADYPALVFYSLSGNDVCNHLPNGGISNMTTPEEMRINALKTLETLDQTLPKGSHVVMMGLADGLVLYDSMHNRIHPLGKLRNDLTYANLYDFLNCLELSPCSGWLNGNETIRNATQERANELSEVLQDIAETTEYKNFHVVYINNIGQDVVKAWIASGKDHEAWQLIEPTDGFHPNQLAMALAGDALVKKLDSKFPHLLGKVNPHNDLIKLLFGDQGGYGHTLETLR